MKFLILFIVLTLMPLSAFAGIDLEAARGWLDNIITYGSSIIAAASVITSMTPTNKDNAVVNVLKRVLEFLAFNFGHAKSED